MMLHNPQTDWMAPPQEPAVPDPTVADAYRMGGLAAMDHYREANPEQVFGAYDRAVAKQRAIEALPQIKNAPKPLYVPSDGVPLDQQIEQDKDLAKFFVPTTPLDAGLMVAGGPVGGKALRTGAAALGALFEPSDAEAGVLSKIKSGIRAYHGSPHDFDRFDLSKIGTGEGAQAYGHGLYFAENEAVARGYRDALKSKAAIPQNAAMTDPQRIAGELFDSYRGQNLKEALDDARHYEKGPLIVAELRKLYASPPQGRMYEVNIAARPEQFLDWDKPLGQQGEVANRILQLPQVAKQQASQTAFLGPDKGLTGSSAYAAASGWKRGAELSPSNPMATTEALREAGIPGIKYLDQGSRGARDAKLASIQPTGDGYYIRGKGEFKTYDEAKAALGVTDPTSNYVVFDPDIIDILRKYGLAGLSAAPAVMGGIAADRSQQ